MPAACFIHAPTTRLGRLFAVQGGKAGLPPGAARRASLRGGGTLEDESRISSPGCKRPRQDPEGKAAGKAGRDRRDEAARPPEALAAKRRRLGTLQRASLACGSRKEARQAVTATVARLAALEGSVAESTQEHLRRHPRSSASWLRRCSRCAFLRLLPRLGPRTVHGELGKSFLVERPAALGGAWGYGCCVCAAARAKCKGLAGVRWNTKWARYEMTRSLRNRSLASQAITHHEHTTMHRAALNVLANQSYHLSLAQDVKADPLAALHDLRVLKGFVPQIEDWRAAWAESSSSVSYNKQESMLCRRLGRRPGCVRKQRRKMVRVMAEVARRFLRIHLRAATSISIALDSSGRFKVLRFRCDTPAAPYVFNGVFGALRLKVTSLEQECEDHGDQAVQKLQAFLRRFCTDLEHGLDEELFSHVCSRVRALSSDGAAAERKALFLAASVLFPETMIVIRDMAHAVRIAAKRPLHMDDIFGRVWKELFDSKDALVPMIQNSGKLREIFESIQRDVLRIPGREKPMETVLKHLSFAKQRFDSFAEPCAKLSVMLLPVCVLLAFLASDERTDGQRRARAAALLRLFTPKFSTALGVSADYGILCQSFLRKFDCGDHDIARSVAELRDFEETLTAVFRKGLLFLSPETASEAGLTATASEGRFCTDWVRKQIRRRCVFQGGSDCFLLWGQCPESDVKDIAERTHLIVECVLQRVHADFDVDQLRRAFQCFDVTTMREGFLKEKPHERRSCLQGVRLLAEAAKLADVARVILDYRDVAGLIVERRAKLAKEARGAEERGCAEREVSNRSAWQVCLQPDFAAEYLPARVAPFVALPALLRIYFSILDGECAVERDLGSVAADIEEHCNLGDDGVDDLFVLKDSWSQEMLHSTHEGVDLLTPALAECTALWRSLYGARFGRYEKGARPDRQKLKSGPSEKAGEPRQQRLTFARFKGGVLRQAALARLSARKLRRVGDVATEYAAKPVSFFQEDEGRSMRKSRHWGPALEKFQRQTERARADAKASLRRRRLGVAFWPKSARKSAGSPTPSLAGISRVCYLGMEEPPACDAESLRGPRACRDADLVVMRSLSILFAQASGQSLVDLLYIVALGRKVVSASAWQKARRSPRNLPPKDVLFPKAGIHRVSAAIVFQRPLQDVGQRLIAAFRFCCARPKSRWSIVKEASSRSGKTLVFAREADVSVWLHSIKSYVNVSGAASRTAGL